MAVGALGAGAVPLPNPLAGLRLVGLPARNPTISLAVAYAGLALVVLAWSRIALRLACSAPALSRRPRARRGHLGQPRCCSPRPCSPATSTATSPRARSSPSGLDPYRLGPAMALGIDNPLVRSIPDLWRDTPAPYGPLFLIIGRSITDLTGETRPARCPRLPDRRARRARVARVGAAPRLARRVGADPDRALWWGAANPLVLFHVVGGAHNDGLMVGLMLAGLEIGLGGRRRPPPSRPDRGSRTHRRGVRRQSTRHPRTGLSRAHPSAQPAADGMPDIVRATGLMTAVATAIYLALALATGLGMGWLTTLEVPGSVVSFLSPTTDLAIGAVVLGAVAGLGAPRRHRSRPPPRRGRPRRRCSRWRAACWARSAAATPSASLASGMAALALLAVQTQPWYLLWALAPAAAATDRPRLHGCWAGAVSCSPCWCHPQEAISSCAAISSRTRSRPPRYCCWPGRASTASIRCTPWIPERGHGD